MSTLKHDFPTNEFILGEDINNEFQKANELITEMTSQNDQNESDIAILQQEDIGIKSRISYLENTHTFDIFVMSTGVTLTDSDVETSLIGTGVGTLIIPSELLIPGKRIQLRALGYITTGATDTAATLKLKLGGVELIANTGTLPINLSDNEIALEAVISIKDNGDVYMNGYTLIQGAPGIATVSMRSLVVKTPITTIDLTEDCAVEHTYKWTTKTVNNSITLTDFFVTIR